jgi:hypothetical protein
LVNSKLRYEIGRLTLEGCYEFGSHEVILECHFRSGKYFLG